MRFYFTVIGLGLPTSLLPQTTPHYTETMCPEVTGVTVRALTGLGALPFPTRKPVLLSIVIIRFSRPWSLRKSASHLRECLHLGREPVSHATAETVLKPSFLHGHTPS